MYIDDNFENQNVADENNVQDSEETYIKEEIETDQSSFDENETDDEDENSTTDADGSDQDPDSDQGDEPGEADKNQDKVKHAFKKKAFQLNEERTKREAAEQRAIEAESKLIELTAPKRPEIPEIPDTYDPEFMEKMQIRDSAMLARAKYDDGVEKQEQAKTDAHQEVHSRRVDEVKVKQEKFVSLVETFGIDEKDMIVYEDAITPYIKPHNAPTVEFILEDDNGPLLIKLLHDDPVELENVLSMNPMRAGVYISNVLTPRALKLKPGTTKTPRPLKTINRRGSVKAESPYLRGAKFE